MMFHPLFAPCLLLAIVAAAPALAGNDDAWARGALTRTAGNHLGLPALPPAEPLSAEKIALGRKLFFDRRLSANGTMSCAMCHVPEQAFANNEMATAVGVEGRTVRRNAPTLINVAFYERLFQDGRETALETQFLSPLTARNEMANPSAGHVVTLLADLPDYRGLFEAAFGAGPSADRIGAALASYQRTLTAGNSRFDRWYYGKEATALSPSERRGFGLFTGEAGCAACHEIGETAALFTDQLFHDTGYGWWREQLRQRPGATQPVEVAPGQRHQVARAVVDAVGKPAEPDLGRYEVTRAPADLWRFRTPNLRNVALTGPYMHDGGLPGLADVVAFYNDGGRPHPGQDPRIRPLGLTAGEQSDLVAFLGALTSDGLAKLIAEARVEKPDNW